MRKPYVLLTDEQWLEARAMYDRGDTQTAIARRFNLDVSTISRRAVQLGWPARMPAVRRKVRTCKVRCHGCTRLYRATVLTAPSCPACGTSTAERAA